MQTLQGNLNDKAVRIEVNLHWNVEDIELLKGRSGLGQACDAL